MANIGVCLTESERNEVRTAYIADRANFIARVLLSPPSIHRALSGVPVQRNTRVALLNAARAVAPSANTTHTEPSPSRAA